MSTKRAYLFVLALGGVGMGLGLGVGVGCAPSVSCPSGTRLKKIRRHSGEHTRISQICLSSGSGQEVRHGPYLFRHLVGRKLRLSKEGGYRHGLRHGRWVLHKGGEVVVTHFEKDYRHGLHQRTVAGAVVARGRYERTLREGGWRFTKSVGGGSVETERVTFREGKRHGAATYHDAQKQLLRRGHYHRGKRHGRWTFYLRGGRVQRDETYFQGVKHGPVRYYDASGLRVRRTCPYVHGVTEPCKDHVPPAAPGESRSRP